MGDTWNEVPMSSEPGKARISIDDLERRDTFDGDRLVKVELRLPDGRWVDPFEVLSLAQFPEPCTHPRTAFILTAESDYEAPTNPDKFAKCLDCGHIRSQAEWWDTLVTLGFNSVKP